MPLLPLLAVIVLALLGLRMLTSPPRAMAAVPSEATEEATAPSASLVTPALVADRQTAIEARRVRRARLETVDLQVLLGALVMLGLLGAAAPRRLPRQPGRSLASRAVPVAPGRGPPLALG